jgi:HlyD family secretion protein
MNRPLKRILWTGLILAAAAAAAAAWFGLRGNGQAAAFRTAAVKHGDLLVSISATGTLVPEEVIDVGAQVAGQIISFGRDASGKTVDYGSLVEAGTVLAKIDDSLYAAEAAQADALVQSARASVQRAEADLVQLQAKSHQAERDWQRARKLGPSEALAEASFDAFKSAYEMATANVAVGRAAILQAKAQLAQAEAGLRRAKRNLGYTTISSPVRGVIIDRRVNIGQTVVASLNAPSLFLIAKDLQRMQVWVAVNEADVGRIRPGLPVTFTVDAFPDETFRGEVGKVRLNASMTQNVVTYTVEVVTDNSLGRLLPYMTANVRFEMERVKGVFLVPNAALRFTPAADQIAPDHQVAAAAAADRPAGPKAAQRPSGAAGDSSSATLWRQADGGLQPLAVRAGKSDGTLTEVSGEGLAEGQKVIVGLQAPAAAGAGAGTPFAPSFPRGSGGAGAGRPR